MARIWTFTRSCERGTRGEDRLYGDSDDEDEQSQPGKEVRGGRESLYDFLERQTRNQIKHTLGHVGILLS